MSEPNTKPNSGDTKIKPPYARSRGNQGTSPDFGNYRPPQCHRSARAMNCWECRSTKVMTFQVMAPDQRTKDDMRIHHAGLHNARANGRGHGRAETRIATTLKKAANKMACPAEHTGGNHGGDGIVAIVMKAIHEIKRQNQHDQQDDDPKCGLHSIPWRWAPDQEFFGTMPSITLATSSHVSDGFQQLVDGNSGFARRVPSRNNLLMAGASRGRRRTQTICQFPRRSLARPQLWRTRQSPAA